MSLCDRCQRPGHCCKNIFLGVYQPTAEAMRQFLIDQPQPFLDGTTQVLPFEPNGTTFRFLHDDGSVSETVRLDCTKLSPDGRCTIYDRRPCLCQKFEPQTDSLCWHYDAMIPRTDTDPSLGQIEGDLSK